MNNKFNLIQEIEATLNIIGRKINQKEYISFVQSNDLLKEYEYSVKSLEEEFIQEEKLEQILKIIENKLKELL